MPYCPVCQREPEGPDSRCALDRVFYVQVRCPACASEILPKERFCGTCGQRCGPGVLRVAAPLEPASVPARVAATLMDALALLVAYEIWLSVGWGSGPGVVALLALAWWSLLPAAAGQTLGQHVLGQVLLTRERHPLPLRITVRRALVAGASWVALLPLVALFRPGGETLVDVGFGTRTWSEVRRDGR